MSKSLETRVQIVEQKVREQLSDREKQLESEREWEVAITKLLEATDPAHRQAVIDAMVSDELRRGAFYDIADRIRRHSCDPRGMMPSSVTEVFLSDPEAGPWCHCGKCGIPLPSRSGIWCNHETRAFYQASLYYFRQCPACGGPIWRRDKPVEMWTFLPERPVPPWTFHTDIPEEFRKK